MCKFRGAGQGIKVLVAEVIVAGLAQALSLRTPRLVELDLGADIARYEADEEVQDLLTASVGSNLGVDFLPGSFGIDSATSVPPDVAKKVRWLDAFTANVDRSWRNPNLLVWHGDVWLIDHGPKRPPIRSGLHRLPTTRRTMCSKGPTRYLLTKNAAQH